MRLKILHQTIYNYSSEVFLEPHYFRFRPKTTPYIQLESFTLDISPDPAGISQQADAENNLVHFAWFDGLVEQVKIVAEAKLITTEYNPFNFILQPAAYYQVPFSYPASLIGTLGDALNAIQLSKPLNEYGQQVLNDSGFDTLPFLTNLTRQIHSDFIVESREIGNAFSPDKTFSLKKGSCRDLAWMQIQLLRNMGFASRFVSGYYYISTENPEFELHGWLEVFLPGAGWLGFDPSNGITTGSTHIPVASSALIENTMPVSGSVRGDGKPALSTNLEIEQVY